jgi:PAS domain S-box-containing protein
MESAENKAEETAARYIAFVESSQDAIIEKDLEGIVTSWNPGAENIFGYPASEMIGHSISRLIPPDRHGEAIRILAQIHRGESVRHLETVRVRKDGTPLHVSLTISPIKDPAGRIVGAANLARDITERKRAEAALRESEARFRSVLDSAQDCIYRLNLQTKRYEYVSPSVIRILGFSPDEIRSQDAETRLAMIHPADLPALRAAQKRLEETGAAEVEHRQRTKSNEYRWYSAHMVLIRDSAGEPLYRDGTVRDINEQKRAETALRESEARFRTICDTSPLGVVLTDLNLNTIYANEAQHRICSLSAEQQAGQNWQAALHPDDRERVIREWQEIGRTGQPFRTERRYRHADGKIVWACLTAAPIRDNVAVHGYVGIVEDITERKRAEEQVRALNQELESRVIERTSELRVAVDALETQIAERRRLEREILEISEREKARVGQDLHDGLCQTLTGIALMAKLLQRNIEDEKLPSAAVSAKAETITNLLKDATNEARCLALGMYPVNIEEYGLALALEKLAADTVERFQIRCKFKSAAPVMLADKQAAAHVYRITQEAVSNAIRHGKAELVLITLAIVGEQITLKIEDNGLGKLERLKPIGMGLKTMNYRARAIGGSLEIRQRARGGLAVICTFSNQGKPEA